MIELELPDGTILEAPDGADPRKIVAGYKAHQKGVSKQKPPEAPPQSGFSKGLQRVTGDVAYGAADILGIPVDTAENVANLLRAAGGVAGHELFGMDPPQVSTGTPGGSEWIKEKLRQMGGGPGDTSNSSAAGRIGDAVLEGAPAAILGKPSTAAEALTGALKTAPASIAAQGAQELGASPAAQQVAGLIPGAVGEHGVSAVRGKGDVQARVDEQRKAGVTNPSPGMVTGNKTMQGAEALMSHLPGSAGVSAAEAAKREAGLGAKVKSIGDKLSPDASPERAGKALSGGIENFTEKFRKQQDKLYSRVRTLIPKDKPIKINSFKKQLQEFASSPEGAAELGQVLNNPKVTQLHGAVQELLKGTPAQPAGPPGKILGPGGAPLSPGEPAKPAGPAKTTITFDAADEVRKMIGRRLEDGLVSGFPAAEMKKLYGALTTDIEGSLGAGTPARKAWDRAREYTRAGHDRIENVLQPIVDRATPEKALNAALAGTREGASAYRRIMRSLPAKDADTVRAEVIRKMGLATPGAQDTTGQRFSVETFSTNWQKMSKEAKAVTFADPKVRADMERIAKVAGEYKAAGRALYNPSGSGKTVGHAAVAVESLREVLTGNFTSAAGIASVPLVTNAAARAMASPKFIKWLAKSVGAKPADFARQVAQLHAIAERAKDKDEREALSTLADHFTGVTP